MSNTWTPLDMTDAERLRMIATFMSYPDANNVHVVSLQRAADALERLESVEQENADLRARLSDVYDDSLNRTHELEQTVASLRTQLTTARWNEASAVNATKDAKLATGLALSAARNACAIAKRYEQMWVRMRNFLGARARCGAAKVSVVLALFIMDSIERDEPVVPR